MSSIESHIVTITLWACFIAGYVVHVLKRANLSAASEITQGTQMRQFLKRNWAPVVIRFFLCSVGFVAWREGSADKVVEMAGRVWGASLPNLVSSSLPATKATTAIYGFFSDSILDWGLARFIPSMQKELPEIQNGGK